MKAWEGRYCQFEIFHTLGSKNIFCILAIRQLKESMFPIFYYPIVTKLVYQMLSKLKVPFWEGTTHTLQGINLRIELNGIFCVEFSVPEVREDSLQETY